MSNNDPMDPKGGRRPAPRRPGSQRPGAPPPPARPGRDPHPAPDEEDDDERTQALNLADFEAALIDDGDKTVSVDAAALHARLAERQGGAPDAGRPAANSTILGHPGVTARSVAAASRAAQQARGRQPEPEPEPDDEGATQALNVDDMLAQIDAGQTTGGRPAGGRPPAPSAPAATNYDDDEGATQALNVDDMLAQIDARSPEPQRPEPRRPAPAPRQAAPAPAPDFDDDDDEDGATLAVNMDDLRALADAGRRPAPPASHRPTYDEAADDDDEEKTQAVSLDMFDAGQRPAPRAEQPPMKPVVAKAPAPAARAATPDAPGPVGLDALQPLPPAASPDGLLGSITYALAYQGRKERIDAGVAAVDQATASGGSEHSPAELSRLRAHYESERAALDPAAAQKGWITLGAIGGGVTVLVVLLSIIL